MKQRAKKLGDEDDENAATTIQGERDANQGYDSSHLAIGIMQW